MLVNGQYLPISRHGQRTTPFDNTTIKRKGGKIHLNAGRGNDSIHVSKLGQNHYGVNVNGTVHSFTAAEMSRLVLKVGKGNDKITVDPSVDIPIHVKGGKGNDLIQNFANGTRIDGNKGRDAILNRGSGVQINGGKHGDHIDSAGSFNRIRGNKGNDVINSVGNGNTIHGGKHRDNINSLGWGNFTSGGKGRDNVNNMAFPPFMQACNCFGGWNNMGNMGFSNGYMDGFKAGFANGFGAGNAFSALTGGNLWNNLMLNSTASWGLEMTATLLNGAFRV